MRPHDNGPVNVSSYPNFARAGPLPEP